MLIILGTLTIISVTWLHVPRLLTVLRGRTCLVNRGFCSSCLNGNEQLHFDFRLASPKWHVHNFRARVKCEIHVTSNKSSETFLPLIACSSCSCTLLPRWDHLTANRAVIEWIEQRFLGKLVYLCYTVPISFKTSCVLLDCARGCTKCML